MGALHHVSLPLFMKHVVPHKRETIKRRRTTSEHWKLNIIEVAKEDILKLDLLNTTVIETAFNKHFLIGI